MLCPSRLLPSLSAILAALALIWSVIILWQTQREASLEHRITRFEQNASLELPSQRDAYLFPCFGNAQSLQARLYLRASARALQRGNTQAYDDYLTAAIDSTLAALHCRPFDGKSWLNLAVMRQEQQGLSAASESALLLSAAMSPKEAWLSELRLPVTLSLLPLTESEALEDVLRNDLTTLNWGFTWRKNRVRERLGIGSLDPLELGLKDKENR